MRHKVGTVPIVRVLVIEDDDAIRSVLERGLATEGFDIESCADGLSGLHRAIDGGWSAIVLDLLLPGMSGYRVCENLRAEAVTTPILVLSAKAGEFDQIDLLDTGADDYLTKPASVALIAARIRALVRRGAALADNKIVRGTVHYDLALRKCQVAGVAVALTRREDHLLSRLLLANGACLSRQELLDEVWGANAGVDPSILDIYVRRLRAKLAPATIENVRGVGYRITSP